MDACSIKSSDPPPGFPFLIYKGSNSNQAWVQKRNVEISRDDRKTLFVSNLSVYITKEVLVIFFGRYGQIEGILIHKRKERRSNLFGFVKFSNFEAAVEAKRRLSGRWIINRRILVYFARRKMHLTNVYAGQGQNCVQKNYEEHQRRIIAGFPNKEVILCISRCWIFIAQEKFTMPDLRKHMERFKISFSNIIRWGENGLIAVCACEVDNVRLEQSKVEIVKDFVKVVKLQTEMKTYQRYMYGWL